MTGSTDDGADDGSPGLDSAGAFSLLGNGTRLEIVGVLHGGSVGTPAQFSTLYDRVDSRDSSKFNYHLKRLRPHFVSKVEGGYELTSAGRRIARAVAAETYTDVPRLDPFETDGTCYACGATALWASYEDELFAIDCRDCGEDVLSVRVPPTIVRGREPGEVVEAFDRWSVAQVEDAARGLCPECGGAVESAVEDRRDDDGPFDALARFDCTVCGRQVLTSFGSIARHHPAVERFHRRRSASLDDRHYWEIGQCVSGEHVRVVSREPWLVRASFHADGDACRVELDGDLDVVGAEVTAGAAPDGDGRGGGDGRE